MTVRYQTFENFHGKRNVGSTRLRVHNLLKHWPEAGIYKYGEKADVMIYQKVYATQDFKYPHHFPGVQILDICDPDWFDGAMIKNMSNLVDGVTCPTQEMADFISQLTDKPIKVVPDRHDIDEVPEPKIHKRGVKDVVWFGYNQNAEVLRFAVPTLERKGFKLTVISNSDPVADRWAHDPDTFKRSYTFKKYDPKTIYQELQKHDVCILPAGSRPQDRFKSNNKTIIAELAGIPVATNIDELEELEDPVQRNIRVDAKRKLAIRDYDVRISVEEMKEFIDTLIVKRGTPPLSEVRP